MAESDPNKGKSKALQSDLLILQLAESIDGVGYFFTLGRTLGFIQATLTNIIGKTEVNLQDVIFWCLYKWRNAQGSHEGEELVAIFREIRLDAVAQFLERELVANPDCLSHDIFLDILASKIDCKQNYRKLGLKLMGNSEARLSNLIGLPMPRYTEAVYQVLIRWRNREGSSLEKLKELKELLVQAGLQEAAQLLHQLEYGADPDIGASVIGTLRSTPSASVRPNFHMPGTSATDSAGASALPLCSTPSASVRPNFHMPGTSATDSTGTSALPLCSNPSASVRPNFHMLGTSATDSAGASALPLNTQHSYYDIYLLYGVETDAVKKVKTIIRRNEWLMRTPDDAKLGALEFASIEAALLACTHVIVIIEGNATHDEAFGTKLTIEMAFKSFEERKADGRVIPIRSCGESALRPMYKALTNLHIDDEGLETRLVNTIDVGVRKKREEQKDQ